MVRADTFRLSQLAAQVELVLKNAFDNIQFWVIADVTNNNDEADTNYHYFELVEKTLGTDKILAKFSGQSMGRRSQEIVTI
jgi:exodeoxyribonuclease VII large subunit